MNPSATHSDTDFIRLLSELLSSELQRSSVPATSSSSEQVFINAILELSREYTSTIQQYNRNIERILQVIERNRPSVEEPPSTRRATPSTLRRDRTASETFPTTAPSHPSVPTANTSDVFPSFSLYRNSLQNNRYGRNRPFTFFNRGLTLNPLDRSDPSPGLLPAEIAAATREVEYSVSANFLSSQCPIRLEEFREGESILQIRGCGHIFTPDDLRRWFERHTCCPVCRRELRLPHSSAFDYDSDENAESRAHPPSDNPYPISYDLSYIIEFPTIYPEDSSNNLT